MAAEEKEAALWVFLNGFLAFRLFLSKICKFCRGGGKNQYICTHARYPPLNKILAGRVICCVYITSTSMHPYNVFFLSNQSFWLGICPLMLFKLDCGINYAVSQTLAQTNPCSHQIGSEGVKVLHTRREVEPLISLKGWKHSHHSRQNPLSYLN